MSHLRHTLPVAVTANLTQQTQQTQSQTPNPQQRRRLFHVPLLNRKFRCSRTRLWDAVLDAIGWLIEILIYAIGPLLIILALGIIWVLTYTFATILLPMMVDKYSIRTAMMNTETLKYSGDTLTLPLHHQIHLGLHCIFVAFVVLNILFNYFYCVTTKHKGSAYDRVVREQAAATNFVYPETPAQVQSYRLEFQDRMALRVRRRRERAQEALVSQQALAAKQQQSTTPVDDIETAAETASPSNGMTQRRSAAITAAVLSVQSPLPPLRQWMLLAPFEWSFCIHSNQPKPPRSHFDHVTKCLVLNMDHYCPWMFNSIGYLNYRYFVNFLIYIFLGMFYGAILTVQPFLWLGTQEYSQQWKQQKNGLLVDGHRLKPMIPFRDERMLISLSFMLCAAVGLAVMLLGSFHIYLTCTAQTTIEFHGNWTASKRAKAAGQKWRNPYSQGSWYKNWQQVYGHDRNIFWALLPSNREPDTLPAPVPGHERRKQTDKFLVDNRNDDDEEEDEANFV
ncbi:hypothetical protein MPSEU_000643100 [Mayamaea pseudoterrestris]|nr:hypothetical protein MPSEU_000643100 [Mayamaea pseudoterrestris]